MYDDTPVPNWQGGPLYKEQKELNPEEMAALKEACPMPGTWDWLNRLDSLRAQLYLGRVIVEAFRAGQKFQGG